MLTVNQSIEIGMRACLEALGTPENGINQMVFRSLADKDEGKAVCCLGRYADDGEYEFGDAITDCHEYVICWVNRKNKRIDIWGPYR